jgi:hypothetical protein
MSSDRQDLIRRFAVAIAGAHQASDFRSYKLSSDEVWRIATSLADREPPQTPADDRIERALQLLREAPGVRNDSDDVWCEGWQKVQQAVQILEGQE